MAHASIVKVVLSKFLKTFDLHSLILVGVGHSCVQIEAWDNDFWIKAVVILLLSCNQARHRGDLTLSCTRITILDHTSFLR